METIHFVLLASAVLGLLAFYFSPYDFNIEEEDE